MIYEIDLILCAISAFFFKNIFTFAIFLLTVYFIFKYLIQKLSNLTIILYLALAVSIFAGGVVLSIISSKEDITCPIMINSYYLGPLAFSLFIALIISIIVDLIIMRFGKTKKKEKKVKKEIKEEKVEKKELTKKKVINKKKKKVKE